MIEPTPPRFLLVVVLAGLGVAIGGCALTGNAALAQRTPSPVKPADGDLDQVLRATLAHMLARTTAGNVKLLRGQARVPLLVDSDYITSHVLPTVAGAPPWLLLHPEEATEIADYNGHFVYVRTELRALSRDEADVYLEYVGTRRHCCRNAARAAEAIHLTRKGDQWTVAKVAPEITTEARLEAEAKAEAEGRTWAEIRAALAKATAEREAEAAKAAAAKVEAERQAAAAARAKATAGKVPAERGVATTTGAN